MPGSVEGTRFIGAGTATALRVVCRSGYPGKVSASAGPLRREAQLRARPSQTEQARRAGVAQSVIIMYASDWREPGLNTLPKIIEATGQKLTLELVPPDQGQLGLPDTPLVRRFRRHRRAVTETLARGGAHNPRVFGSAARAEDTQDSDIDLLVDLDDTVGLVTLARLTRELTELLGIAVDIVPAATLKPGVRERVLAEAIVL